MKLAFYYYYESTQALDVCQNVAGNYPINNICESFIYKKIRFNLDLIISCLLRFLNFDVSQQFLRWAVKNVLVGTSNIGRM